MATFVTHKNKIITQESLYENKTVTYNFLVLNKSSETVTSTQIASFMGIIPFLDQPHFPYLIYIAQNLRALYDFITAHDVYEETM